MVAGPEIARMLQEFEEVLGFSGNKDNEHHHEDTRFFEARFTKDVQNLVKQFREDGTGNPFLFENLVTVGGTEVLMSAESINSVNIAEQVGQEQYKLFVEERFTMHSLQVNP